MTIQNNESTDARRGIDYIGVSASFVIYDDFGRILLQKRGQNCRDEKGKWDNGGGAIEFGENFDQALRREIEEELCTVPISVEPLVTYDSHRTLDDDTLTHWIACVFAVKVDPTRVKIGEPHKIDEIGWYSSANLPTPLHSQFFKSYDVAREKGFVK